MTLTVEFRSSDYGSSSRQDVITDWGDNLQLLYTEHTAEIKRIISEEMKKFFADKRYYIGGPIPDAVFTSAKYVKMLAFTDMTQASLAVHAHYEDERRRVKRSFELLEFHTEVIISVIQECNDLEIPPCFCPGLILMYFEICEGQRIQLLN